MDGLKKAEAFTLTDESPENIVLENEYKDTHLFSFYKAPISNTAPFESLGIEGIYQLIKSEQYRFITEKLRSFTTQKGRDSYKIQMFDYVTFSGIFKHRANAALIQHSWYFCIDIDHFGNSEAIRAFIVLLLAIYTPALMFISPSGDGLKIIFKIDITEGNHEQYFTAFQNFFRSEFNTIIDDKCKDVSRACFLPFDPESFMSETPDILGRAFIDTFAQLQQQKQISKEKVVDSSLRKDDLSFNHHKEIITDQSTVINNLTVWANKNYPFVNGNRNKYVSELCGAFNRSGVTEAEALNSLLQYSEPGFTEREIRATVRSIYNNTGLHGIAPFEQETKPQTHIQQPQTYNQPLQGTKQPDYFQTRSIGEVFEAGANEPARLRIFGDFLRQQTNTLLYSNTNYGKSFLAFQIALNAATGNSFADCEQFRNECTPMKVLLGEFELDAKDLTDRHAVAWQYYDNKLLNSNLKVLHENPKATAVYGANLLQKIEEAAISTNADLVIIDNLTKVCPDLLKADQVSIVIDTFRRIRQKTGASFLIIGHTVKSLQNIAITENSYYGSAHIANFFTEIFYLDKTNNGLFFLKHAKTKQKEAWTDIVPVLSRGDHQRDGTGFSFVSLQPIDLVQMRHANTTEKKKPSEFLDEIKAMAKAGISQVRIAEIFGCSRSAINQLLTAPDTFPRLTN